VSTLKTTNLQAPSAASPAIVLASDGTATAQLSSLNGGALSGARNRIINGDMRIDQRNAGASVTTAGSFPVDRWNVQHTSDGAFSAQRSTVAPTSFNNSLGFTITTADSSLAANQQLCVQHNIEGFNAADFDFGTANAKTVTLSFWVRSSLTGTFGGSFKNNAANRSYPFTYSISAANTWEYKSVSVSGDTTGTWLADNSIGLTVTFGLGVGSDRSGTAGAWNSNNNNSATGAVSVIGTLNATFYITGVQLEAGSVATPFERRSYGQELALCQRYYQGVSGVGRVSTSNGVEFWCKTPVLMRATPTAAIKSGAQGYQFGRAAGNLSSIGAYYLGADGAGLTFASSDTGMAVGAVSGCTGDVAFLSAEL
jgi:hypothetical protein